MKLTGSQVRYLLAVYELTGGDGETSSAQIADMLDVTRPSVNKMLEVLASKQLLEKRRYGSVRLTEQGLSASRQQEHGVRLLSEKLAGLLGCSPAVARRCSILLMGEAPDLFLSAGAGGV